MSEQKKTLTVDKETHYKESKADQRANKAITIKADEEAVKLQYDAFKHLTTLNTASILLLVAFLEKLFINPRAKFLVAFAFLCFIVSILTSFVLMILLSGIMRFTQYVPRDKDRDYVEKHLARFLLTSVMSFVVAIICLSVFALINLFK